MDKGYSFCGVLMIGAVILILAACKEESPQVDINRARLKLAEAELIKAFSYAPELFQKASSYYDSAFMAWQHQNKRFIGTRDFATVKRYCNQSMTMAESAAETTRRKTLQMKDSLSVQIGRLQQSMADFDRIFGHYPMDSKDRKRLVKSKMMVSEGEMAYKQGNFWASSSSLQAAEVLMTSLQRTYQQRLLDYFSQYDQWQRWIDQTIAHSKQNRTTCIIVDKFARECVIYKSGKVAGIFPIELGAQWIGPKTRQGDKATPEGLYSIVARKAGGATQFYKALLLNYPNAEDRVCFERNQKNGRLPSHAKIGNLIEIHGHGGKGADWTDGCVALTNTDMDRVFADCGRGHWVTIVGSVKPLNELVALHS